VVLIVDEDHDTEDVWKMRSNKVTTQPVKITKVDARAVPPATHSEELVLRIVRGPGLGLGMSVTGGVGTTAFKDGDEVAVCIVLMTAFVNWIGSVHTYPSPLLNHPQLAPVPRPLVYVLSQDVVVNGFTTDCNMSGLV